MPAKADDESCEWGPPVQLTLDELLLMLEQEDQEAEVA